jgi:drug/metabolite transporter (DMT)-like permease
VTAVLLALGSAVLFGAMSPALRRALDRAPDAELGALASLAACFSVCLVAAIVEVVAQGGADLGEVWPFVVAGLVAPGASQILFLRAIDASGPARTSAVVGAAPLVSVAIALTLLDEPLRGPLIAGAVLIVGGGLFLAAERDRPEHFRAAGIGFALGATVLFASRDNAIRWLAGDTDVEPTVAAAATAGAGAALVLAYLLATREGQVRASVEDARAFVPAGLANGLSYVLLFAAYYRGRVTVVSPLVATEALFGVLFSALALGRTELIGRHLVVGAALIVAGGALIGAFR